MNFLIASHQDKRLHFLVAWAWHFLGYLPTNSHQLHHLKKSKILSQKTALRLSYRDQGHIGARLTDKQASFLSNASHTKK